MGEPGYFVITDDAPTSSATARKLGLSKATAEKIAAHVKGIVWATKSRKRAKKSATSKYAVKASVGKKASVRK